MHVFQVHVVLTLTYAYDGSMSADIQSRSLKCFMTDNKQKVMRQWADNIYIFCREFDDL